MRHLTSDIRFSWRSLRREPGFLAVTLATLALGVGTTTAMFTLINGVLLRPLPYADPASLAVLQIEGKRGGIFPLPDTDFLALRADSPEFERTAVFARTSFSLTGSGAPEIVRAAWVSGDFFTTLGLQPFQGRFFAGADDAPGAVNAVVLSHAFWMRLGGDPSIIGRPLRLDDEACTVIGVAGPGISMPGPNLDLWRNLRIGPPKRRGPFYLTGLVRLHPGATLAAARPALDHTSATIHRQYGGPSDWHFHLTPLIDAAVGDARTPLYLLMAAVSLLMLIAVANVANLMLARASARQHELAVRTALGATRARIAAQLLTEAGLLGAAGAVLGLVTAVWLTRALLTVAAAEIPRAADVRVDPRVLLFAVAVSAVAALVFGAAPAWHSRGGEPADPLREHPRSGAARASRRLQRAFVVAEIALALVMSVGAGLLIRSLVRLQHVDPGFESRQVVTFQVNMPSNRYRDDASINEVYERLLARIASVPGVRSAATSVSLPPDRLTITDNFTAEGKVYGPNESAPVGVTVIASDDYFRTLGIPLLSGRAFDARDRQGAEPVVIVSRTLANRYYPHGDALGHRFKTGGPERPNNAWMRIVGIVGDVRYEGLAADPGPAYYLPFRQNTWSDEFIAVQTAVDPASVVPALREAVWQVDRDLPLADVRTMTERMTSATATPRFRTLLLAGFGVLGLVLAMVGVYGVVSYGVSQRTHEIGVRVALGAQRGDVMRLVLREGATLAAIGIAAGLAAAWWAARATESLLYGVAPRDPLTFAVVAPLLVATALAASWIPARRAARVSPLTALREG